MELNQILGYILLLAGLLLIVVPLWQTYQIFTGATQPPQVFGQQETQPVLEPESKPNNPFDIQQQVQKGLMSMLPIDLINNTLNLTSWMILMWVLIFGGKQLCDIGIKLLRSNPEYTN